MSSLGFWLLSKENPSDDPIHSVPLRKPVSSLPLWFREAAFGKFGSLDAVHPSLEYQGGEPELEAFTCKIHSQSLIQQPT